jgi:hypothetical protein
MASTDAFGTSLAEEERAVLDAFRSPWDVQQFLDTVPYSTDPFYRSPLRVLRERRAHCFDGAVFAAAALRRLGHPPRILELKSSGRDDEHLLALFRAAGAWGAVAKSNFVGLRYREPVYRTLRELAMSYFEAYYNVEGEKTLRGYAGPLHLGAFDRQRWTTDDAALEAIARRTDEIRRFDLITPAQAAALSPVDRRSYDAGLTGADPAGLFAPGA